LHHRRYDVLWEVCSDLNLPVIVHVSRGHPAYLGDNAFMVHFMHVRETIWYGQRAVYCMIMGGVLERYPNLHLIPTELGLDADWVPQLLQALDSAFDNWSDTRAGHGPARDTGLSMKPSEYWQRQCYITHSIGQRREQFEGDAYDRVPNMIFGADIGHDEGWWPVVGFPEPKPKSMEVFASLPVVPVENGIKALLGGLQASKMLPYLRDNFFKAYPNVDQAALKDVVERIGPTASELGLV
jgi:predicted TIM-barrel fold metal-dependent hydrolase